MIVTPTRSPWLARFALAAVLVAPSAASAEEKNPAAEACAGKQDGDGCKVVRTVKGADGALTTQELPGLCRPEQCCELDYSKGSPPDTKCGPCLACKVGPPVPTPDPPDVKAGGSEGGQSSEPPRVGDTSDPPATSPSKRGGCRVGDAGGGWAGVIVLVGWARARARARGAGLRPR